MKKVFLTLFTLLVFAGGLYSLPGFKSFVPDVSGDFIYYRDYSFERESYIGLLTYDQNTYQIRYYAPSSGSLPEKTVATIFTVDSSAENFTMTGENVFIADYSNPEDVDIVNYMHDLLYEFSKRRITLGDITPSAEDYVKNKSLKENGLTVSSDFPQFGGNVYIIYDLTMPLFNIKRIENSKGNSVFECIEIGRMESSEDDIFDKPVIIPEIRKVKQNSVKPKKLTPEKVTLRNQSITLDSSWSNTGINYTQGDDAMITMFYFVYDKQKRDEADCFLLRAALQSRDGNYLNLNKTEVIYSENGFNIYSDSYIPSSSKVFYSVKKYTLNSDGYYDYLAFAATKANYLLKRSYYDKIIKSYSND